MRPAQPIVVGISFLVLTLSLLLAGFAGAARADGTGELQRTWERAWIFAPAADAAGYRKLAVSDLRGHFDGRDRKPRAVVLYAHGCDGLSGISAASGRFLAQAGYLVVEPDSFARAEKPVSCKAVHHRGGLHRAALGWRQDEIRYAAGKLATFASLRRLPLVLMGHSEGAIAVATITNLPAAGRIIEGWTCHAGWPEYRGLAAPAGQPVLALVGADDPWFREPVLRGDCGPFMHGAAQRSAVFEAPDYLARKHWLSSDPDIQKMIVGFIREITK